ncbi:MOSC domain-containing protein [Kaarinaea lacus]
MQLNFKDLQDTLPQHGKIRQIFIRPEKYTPPLSVQQVTASSKNGLKDDHYRSSGSNKRQVTLIQYEHIAAMASLLGVDSIDASLLRRNLVVSGINLLALKDKVFSVGDCQLEMTGLCHPCSRMEKALGPGGYNAMRGHGGITARVVRDGIIRINDLVRMVR